MSSVVRAEAGSADRTLAAALFRDGKALMDKGDFATACGKLEESQRIDPGGGTILNLALCHEKQGRIATAWAEFIEALGIAKRDRRQGRIDLAEDHIGKLEPMLSKMTIQVPPESDDPALQIQRDGAVVGRAAWGTPFPVDPGDHRVEATAAGKVAYRTTVTVATAPGATPMVVRIPPLQADAVPEPPAPPAAVVAVEGAPGAPPGSTASQVPAAAPTHPSPADHASNGSSQAVWGWAAIGLGGAGVITGTVLTVVAAGKNSDSKDRCPRDPCDAAAVQLSRDAGHFADFATVGFGVGAAALVAGVVLLVTDGPSHPEARARQTRLALYPDGGRSRVGMALRGQF
jgi:hypothetical protein